jgi:hypothetical protein
MQRFAPNAAVRSLKDDVQVLARTLVRSRVGLATKAEHIFVPMLEHAVIRCDGFSVEEQPNLIAVEWVLLYPMRPFDIIGGQMDIHASSPFS